MELPALFKVTSLASAAPLIFAVVLALILIVSFRSRARVFCQYLKRMTGIQLKPKEVNQVYKRLGQDGVREMFLDLIIRQDLKGGPLSIPADDEPAAEESSAEIPSPEDAPPREPTIAH